MLAAACRFRTGLGALLGVAGLGYLADSFCFFLIPGYDGSASAIVLAPVIVAELWLALWLLLSRTGMRRRERTGRARSDLAISVAAR